MLCEGSEHSIQDCSSYTANARSCTHAQDVGVRCEDIEHSGKLTQLPVDNVIVVHSRF